MVRLLSYGRLQIGNRFIKMRWGYKGIEWSKEYSDREIGRWGGEEKRDRNYLELLK